MSLTKEIDMPIYAERVIERNHYGFVIRSELVPVSELEGNEELTKQCTNPCGHVGVTHESGWMYDIVKCAVCGDGMGLA